MAKEAKTKKQVRPTAVIPIDWKLVGRLLQAGNSGVGIASRLGIHENTLYGRCKEDLQMDFVAFRAQKKVEGNDLIHTKQFDVAMAGNVSMLIWIGKQRLGQSDRNDLTSDGEKLQTTYILDFTGTNDGSSENRKT